MKNAILYKRAAEVILFCVCVFLFFSCIPSGAFGLDFERGFSLSDSPSEYVWPHNDPSSNLCGRWGAFPAYYIMKYIGPGIFVLLGTAMWWLGVNIAGRSVTQPILRLIGVGLLTVAFSSSVYLICPVSEDGFPMGNGGILGIASGAFLLENAKTFGAFIILASIWLVGLVLLADALLFACMRWLGAGVSRCAGFVLPALSVAKVHSSRLSDIWDRISWRQRVEVGVTEEGDALLEEMADEEEYEYEYVDEDEEDEDEEDVAAAVETKKQRKGKSKNKRVGAKKQKPYEPKTYDDYELPPLDLLEDAQVGYAASQVKMVEKKARVLEGLLSEFGINAGVVNTEPGPAITMYELELAPGIKVSQISNLSNDMARALGAGSVRVVAPLPGKHTIGIEAPNAEREIVRMKEVIEQSGPKANRMQIPLFLGKTSSGEALVSDLTEMPHLLIAGTTGSGKSVCINSIITSVMMMKRPDEVKLILIDPKMVEMAAFESLPHLMCPTVTEMRRAEQILEWATTKMDERYEILAEAKVRNVASFNKLGSEEIIRRFNPSTPEEEAKIPKRLPYIVIIIDELADLMMTSAKEVEAYIVRIAQKSRAVGIHLIVATQRPQATVVTGLIKSNMPARIGFKVASRMDSRIILDQNGGETLLGQGDMLFLKPGTSDLARSQGVYLDDEEIHAIMDHLKDAAEAQFHPELMQLNRVDLSGMSKDDLYDDAVRVVLETGRGSVSLLQRRLGVGYARASRIIEMMAAGGLLGEYKGSQAREVTMTVDEYDAMRQQMLEDEVAGYADLATDDGGEEDEYEEEEYEEEEEGEEEEEYEEDEDDEDDEEYED